MDHLGEHSHTIDLDLDNCEYENYDKSKFVGTVTLPLSDHVEDVNVGLNFNELRKKLDLEIQNLNTQLLKEQDKIERNHKEMDSLKNINSELITKTKKLTDMLTEVVDNIQKGKEELDQTILDDKKTILQKLISDIVNLKNIIKTRTRLYKSIRLSSFTNYHRI